MKTSIRLSAPGDTEKILAFVKRSGFNPRDALTWDGLGMLAMTAWEGEELVGAIPLEPRTILLGPGRRANALHQTVVAIAESHRSAGLGSRMQNEIPSVAPSGVEMLSVFREEPSSRAYRWYTKNGFSSAMHIESWFCDEPKGEIADVKFTKAADLKATDELTDLWRKQFQGAAGLIDRDSRPLSAWLMIHPYRGLYEFWLAHTGGAYALLGVGTMHSETKRIDVLEFVSDNTTGEKLLRAIAGWASKEGLRPVRWPLATMDAFVSLAQVQGFERRWGFDMMVKPLVGLALPADNWRYSGIDYA